MGVRSSFIIVLVGNSDVIVFKEGNWGEFSAGIDRFMSLLVMSITLVASPAITLKIVNGMGLHAATLASGKMAALAAFTKGFSVPFLGKKRKF